APPDDLRRIKGIGPKFAERLGALGVASYADIAAWQEGDVQSFADALGIKAARIRREQWVERAREFVSGPASRG
ncbi:MAG: hypothetical protein HY908_22085, partial [Myxococcales bacterium]|nr:hypothetical protein [Myxococcales bacterium]